MIWHKFILNLACIFTLPLLLTSPAPVLAQGVTAAEASPPTAQALRCQIVDTASGHFTGLNEVQLRDYSEGLPQAGLWQNGFALADMNKDGQLDLIHGSPRKFSSPPAIFLQRGDGLWTRWEKAQFPEFDYQYGDVEIGDFNGDGKIDIALGMHLTGVSILLGDGSGVFSAKLDSPTDTASPVVHRLGTRTLAALPGRGDSLPTLVALGEGMSPTSLLSGKSTNYPDRGLYLVTAGSGGNWQSILLSGSRHVFGSSLTTFLGRDKSAAIAVASQIQGQGVQLFIQKETLVWQRQPLPDHQLDFVWSVAAADLTRDGTTAIIAAGSDRRKKEWFSRVILLTPSGKMDWVVHQLLEEKGREVFAAIGAGDLNGDSMIDLAILKKDGSMLLLLGGKSCSFQPVHVTRSQPDGCKGQQVQLQDLNGDGRDEIIASFASEPNPRNPLSCQNRGRISVWSSEISGSASGHGNGHKLIK